MKCKHKHCGGEIHKDSDGVWIHNQTGLHVCIIDTVAEPEKPPEPEYDEVRLEYDGDKVLRGYENIEEDESWYIASNWQNHKRYAGYRYEHPAWNGPRYYMRPVLHLNEIGRPVNDWHPLGDGDEILHPVAVRLRKET